MLEASFSPHQSQYHHHHHHHTISHRIFNSELPFYAHDIIFYAPLHSTNFVSLCDKQFAKTYFHRWYRKFMFLFICYVIEKGNKFCLLLLYAEVISRKREHFSVLFLWKIVKSFNITVHKINNSFADRKLSVL